MGKVEEGIIGKAIRERNELQRVTKLVKQIHEDVQALVDLVIYNQQKGEGDEC